jgi:capsular polysaccharide export protein
MTPATPPWDSRPRADEDAPDPHGRSFLFLQGPQSRFFRSLGLAIRDYGARVLKVNFCGGDVFHWPRPCTRLYRGGRRTRPPLAAEVMDSRAGDGHLRMGSSGP